MSTHTETPRPLLSEPQRRLVAFATSFGAVVISIGLVCLCISVLGQLLDFFSSVLWPLFTAIILALMLRPCVDFLEHKLKMKRIFAVIVLFAVFLLAASGVLMLVLPPLVGQIVDFVAYVPELWTKVVDYTNKHYPEWRALVTTHLENPTVRQIVDTAAGEIQGLLSQAIPSIKAAGGGLLSLFTFLTALFLIPVYLFFFLLGSGTSTNGNAGMDSIGAQLGFLRPSLREDIVFLVKEFVAIIVSFFRGQLLICLIMGLLLATGFSLIGLKFGLFLGLACGLLNIIPYLGTTVGLLTTLPLAFFQPDGGWKLVGLVLLVKIIVQNIEGWVLTPKIMGERTGLHPAAIIFSLFFWAAALGGLLGMILAIPLSAFFVTAWRLAKRKYFSQA